jgi:hypothetical protein
MERNARPHARLVWLASVYAAVIAIVLYPALHEELGAKLLLWNCIPPSLGLLAIVIALDKSRARRIVFGTFALLTAIVATFFSAAWFFTPLDTDPHSLTTILVFVFAPALSLALATIVSGLAWFAVRIT